MSLFNNKPTPVRLHKKVSWREKYEVEIIFAKGIILIILLFIFAFCIVGQMDPSVDDEYHDLEGGII